MRWRKLAAFVLSAAVLAFGLVGCAFDANSSQDGTPSRRTVPIIAMTANAFADDKLQAREAGMDEHLAKPLDSELLLRTIARLARGKKD